MKVLILVVCLLSVAVQVDANIPAALGMSFGQVPAFVPTVLPNMIEISADGVAFIDATPYVSNITVTSGVIVGTHTTHGRRGSVGHWEAQLGTPYENQKVEWFVDTALFPDTWNRYYMRYSWAVEEPIGSGVYKIAHVSSVSAVVKLIGPGGKPKNK